MRGVHPGVMIVPEEQHGRGDGQLRQCQRRQYAPQHDRLPLPGTGRRNGREHLGGEIAVEEGAAETDPPRHRVCSLLPGAAVRAARQVLVEGVAERTRVFAVDPGRDGLAGAFTVHA